MLRALYEYGKTHPDAVLSPGCAKMRIDYVVNIGADGTVLGVEKDGNAYVRPYFKITAAPLAEPFAEKACISVGMDPVGPQGKLDTKRASFMSYLDDAGGTAAGLGVVAGLLRDSEAVGSIRDMLADTECTGDSIVGFRYDGIFLHDLPGVMDWWCAKYAAENVKVSRHEMLDVVTGRPCTAVMTSGKSIKPPYLPDAQTSGAAFVTFNSAAFESYGLRQNENAAMSAESTAYAMDALLYLCERASALKQRIGNIRFVHWYSGRTADPELDLVSGMLFGTDDTGSESDETDEAAAGALASSLVRSPLDGVEPVSLAGYEYHILLLSAQGARVAVLGYERGDYGWLYEKLKKWRDDFSLCRRNGMSLRAYKPVGKMLGHLITASESNSNSPFAGIKTQYPYIMAACVNGGALPRTVLARALLRFQSDIVKRDGDTGKSAVTVNYSAASWIKAYLIRHAEQKKEESGLMAYLNENHANPAYHCGRAMAVYAELQASAKTVNAGVTERFYAACMRSPALVLGQLQGMANHWLEDLEYRNKKRILEDALRSAYGAIDGVLPKNLSMEDRGYFTMGYVQQQAALNKAFSELRAAKNDTVNDKEEVENG